MKNIRTTLERNYKSSSRKLLKKDDTVNSLLNKNLSEKVNVYCADSEIGKLTPYQMMLLDKEISKYILKQRADISNHTTLSTNKLKLDDKSIDKGLILPNINNIHNNNNNNTINNNNNSSFDTSILKTNTSSSEKTKLNGKNSNKHYQINKNSDLFLTSNMINSTNTTNTNYAISPKSTKNYNNVALKPIINIKNHNHNTINNSKKVTKVTENFGPGIPDSLRVVFKKKLKHMNNNLDSINYPPEIMPKTTTSMKSSYQAKQLMNLMMKNQGQK